MAHNHTHQRTTSATNIGKAFVISIILNAAFVVIEFVTGFYTNSLALLSDAGHNLSDVVTLGLSLFAFQMTKRKANETYTYGLNKSTILVSLVNAILLLIVVGGIGLEAIKRFTHPEETQGKVISMVASIGIIINTISALLFFREKDKDLNIKGAYLHLAVDALVSIGVVMAGVIIYYTGIKWIDPLISLLVMAVVIYSTWGLLAESLKLSLDAVPSSIDVDKIKQAVLKIKGVKEIHHVHIWAMSTTKNAMTAHLILERDISEKQTADIKHTVKHELEHLNIQHTTLETESIDYKEDTCKEGATNNL